MRHEFGRLGVWVVILSIVAVGEAFSNEPPSRSTGQLIYVPVYSHIYVGDRESPFPLAATVSIRNTDPKHSITVTAVDYHNSEGRPVRKYLDETVRLSPLASIRRVVKESDREGGSGASFLVRWEASAEVSPPIVESVMIGTRNQQGISFTSRGQVIPPGK